MFFIFATSQSIIIINKNKNKLLFMHLIAVNIMILWSTWLWCQLVTVHNWYTNASGLKQSSIIQEQNRPLVYPGRWVYFHLPWCIFIIGSNIHCISSLCDLSPSYHYGKMVKGVLHPWALFLKTLCIFSKNKVTSDKVSYGSGQKCSKELKNHSFTSVETIVVKLQWKMCENQYFPCFEP